MTLAAVCNTLLPDHLTSFPLLLRKLLEPIKKQQKRRVAVKRIQRVRGSLRKVKAETQTVEVNRSLKSKF